MLIFAHMDEVLTTEEAAEVLGVTVTTVRSHIRNGRIEAKKRGRQWWITMNEAIRYRDRPQKTGRPKKKEKRTNEAAAPTTTDTPEK